MTSLVRGAITNIADCFNKLHHFCFSVHSGSTERWVSLGERARTGTHTLQHSLTDYNAFLDKAKESRIWLAETEGAVADGFLISPGVESAQEMVDANQVG